MGVPTGRYEVADVHHGGCGVFEAEPCDCGVAQEALRPLPSARGRIDAETKTGHAEVKVPHKYTADRLSNLFRVFHLEISVSAEPQPWGNEWTVRAEGPQKNLTAAMMTFQNFGDIIMGEQ